MLEYINANEILMNAFEAMKKLYHEDEFGGYDGISHCFYSENFVPYIVQQLNDNNESELKKIFVFVERLFAEGDEDIINLAGASVVESTYNEDDYEKHRDKIFSLCGPLTRKSFEDMDGE